MSENLSQIRFFAENYSRLQGLRMVPYGMLMVFISVWAVYNHGPNADLSAPILAAIGAALLYWLIDRYYGRVYGRVKPTAQRKIREYTTSVAVGVVALLAFWLDVTFELPVSFIGLIFSATLFGDFWRATKSVRGKALAFYPENALAALLILIISILPLFGISWWQYFGLESQVVSVVIVNGIIMILAGSWGHLRILRVLPMVETKANDNAI